MQYTFANNPAFAVEGMTVGDRRSRSFDLDWRAQIGTITLADASAAASETMTVSITDENGVVWSFTVTTGATVALTLAALTDAFRANAKANSLFSVTDDASTVLTYTARHANKVYAIAVTMSVGSTMTGTHAITTAAGGSGVEAGRVVRRIGERSFDALLATSVLADIAGLTFRTDGNVLHDREIATDALRRGKTHSILGWGLEWVKPETAVAPGDPVYVRRALTSSAGTVGKLRNAPAGTTQVATITVVADHQFYRVVAVMIINGQRRIIDFEYDPTDGTTTTDDVVDGLEDAGAARITALGLDAYVSISAASASATFTMTAAAGYEFESVDGTAWGEDTEAEALTVSLATADVDTIDISSIASWESTASADGFALLRFKLIS